MSLFLRKDISALQAEVGRDQSLKRALGPVNLVALGIGAIIGAGIFVLTGQAAANYAGPAIVYSFILAGLGCGAAGVLTVANTLFIVPHSIFGVQWTAYMIFAVLVGGLGTFEGPIIGAILLFAIQTVFSDGGPWYLVGLGATAGLFALLLPRGLWGTVEERLGIRLLPIGYRVSGGSEPRKEEG